MVQALSPELVLWLEEQRIPASLFKAPAREPSLADVKAVLPEIPALRFEVRSSASGRTYFDLSSPDREDDWAELVVGEGGRGVSFTYGSRGVITAAVGHLARHCGPLVVVHASGERPSLISATPTTIDVVGGWAEDF